MPSPTWRPGHRPWRPIWTSRSSPASRAATSPGTTSPGQRDGRSGSFQTNRSEALTNAFLVVGGIRPPRQKEFEMATNTEIVKDAYASFAAGDVPGALSAFADDILWVEPDGYPIIGGTYVGPQAVVEGVFMRLAEIGDEFAVVP